MNKVISSVLFGLFILVIACKSDHLIEDCSTLSGATYNSNGGKIQSILNSRCSGTDCHSTGGAGTIHWTLGSTLSSHFYEEGVETVMSGTMPPAGSIKLTTSEITLLGCWKDANYPR